jgi:hypothetical protein
MLAVSAGRLVALSTPYGKRGWFYQAWTGEGLAPAGTCGRADTPPVASLVTPREVPTLVGRGGYPRSGCRPGEGPPNPQSEFRIPQSPAGWHRFHLPAASCPRISPAFLDEERRALGPWWFGQEYECQFLDTTDQVFATADVESALDAHLEPLFPDLL